LQKYQRGAPKFWGAPFARGHAHLSFACDFMLGLGKPLRFAKFEDADFICYGNVRKFVLKFEINQIGETPYHLEKLILPLDSQTQYFLFDMQLLCSYDYSKWAIFTKNRILQ